MLSRGRRSRNKVSVGEPADGSVWLFVTTVLLAFALPAFYKLNFQLRNLKHK